MKNEELNLELELHMLWLKSCKKIGTKANLINKDLSYKNLSNINLKDADLNYANLTGTNLSGAQLVFANLRGTNLTGANLSGANLSGAILRGANLLGANLLGTNLNYADLSSAIGSISQIDFLEKNFEKTKEGYIAYKVFSSFYPPSTEWVIEEGSIINENVNFNRCSGCGCGINVATLDWVKSREFGDLPIWKVLICWEWLGGVCVPYNSDGKIRCERVKLIERLG